MRTLTIQNFHSQFFTEVMTRARKYVKENRVQELTRSADGQVNATVRGSSDYKVRLRLSSDGTVTDLSCNCPYNRGGYCKHIAAVLLILEKDFERKVSTVSSGGIAELIHQYTQNLSRIEEADRPDEEKMHIVPVLHIKNDVLDYELKIGRTRFYSCGDIQKLYHNFQYQVYQKYGKELEFVHTFDAIDEKSKRLLELSVYAVHIEKSYYYSWGKTVNLRNSTLDRFFELYRDEAVQVENRPCQVWFADPDLTVTVSSATNDRYKLSCDNSVRLLGMGDRHTCFYDGRHDCFLLASTRFSKAVSDLYQYLCRNENVYISAQDMPAFYAAVIKPMVSMVNFKGLDLLENLIPPEASPQLYIDCGEENEIFANLTFTYGEQVVPAFAERPSCFYHDPIAENHIEQNIFRYFTRVPDDEQHPLAITDPDAIYLFLTEGLPELSKCMEVYVSDRFRRIAVRPPVKASVGIRPDGGLLDLSITDENYTPEELIALLSSYRRGAKYHRLKDGSFVLMDESVAELNELTANLNLHDRELLKEHIKIPKYRMLYLESLRQGKNVRLQSSEVFRQTVNAYRSRLERSDEEEIPDTLQSVMRNYQKQGFRWMNTIAAYGFGGILADDMGLGKTLQAISLLLYAKQQSDVPQVSLIVCPSSLTLNWVNEIHKFAPELKALAVIGTAGVRNRLIGQVKNFDVVITSYSALTRDIAKYEDLQFRFQLIDEAQYIKNHNTQMAKAVKGIHSELRFALTGTPVENSLAELWSIFDFIMPGYLFDYPHFKKNFEEPIVSGKDKNAVRALQKNVSPFILRRLKKDVLTELPDKTETVLVSQMEGEQRRIYEANVALVRQDLSGQTSNDPKERIKILAMLTRLRQICCDPGLVYENYTGKSAKLEQCMELIESCAESGHKILLFSQFTSMMRRIIRRLDEAGISYYTLTGSTQSKERIRLVNAFNENDTKVFLISLKAGGTGLNLTGADIVIHYDPWWNLSAENQASDRAYRIGQTRNVQVYKLIADQSIEQNILRLQQSKADLSNLAVGGEADITRMSAEEMMELLG